jgi:hypothetical protein
MSRIEERLWEDKRYDTTACCGYSHQNTSVYRNIREPFEKFVDWRQCAAAMQREAITVMPSFSDGSNVVVA